MFLHNNFSNTFYCFISVADHDLKEPCCCDPHGNRHNQRPVTKYLRVIIAADVEKNPKLGKVLGKHWCDNCRKGNAGDTSRKRLKSDSAEPDFVLSKSQKTQGKKDEICTPGRCLYFTNLC